MKGPVCSANAASGGGQDCILRREGRAAGLGDRGGRRVRERDLAEIACRYRACGCPAEARRLISGAMAAATLRSQPQTMDLKEVLANAGTHVHASTNSEVLIAIGVLRRHILMWRSIRFLPGFAPRIPLDLT